ncbi:unnamed protein product [Sphagnum jensenii]|uniref:Uncharacterized protein n=1 Tax=Sphagnum jensenii TaxID=128206 RepID=A0ABP1APF7_9BRYO
MSLFLSYQDSCEEEEEDLLFSRCLCLTKNSRAAAAATVYLVYILEVLDNLYEQFGVPFMYLFEAESFGT